MKKLLIVIVFILLSVLPSYAEYFSDIIVTGPNGVWIDNRAYSTIADAITAASTNTREVHVYSQATCIDLIVPSNVTLVFGKDGSIANSGTLTLQTKNIIGPDRQIFTGTGQIDFASGTIVRSSWFQNFETALALTSNDNITLIVTKPQTLTASFAVGNNVYLKWDSPNNIITVGSGVTLSNVNHIEAGTYQILAGSGTVSFTSGITLKLDWFTNLRAILTWLSTTPATLEVYGTNIVDYSDTVQDTIILVLKPSGVLSISATKSLSIPGTFINEGGHFDGDGSVTDLSVADPSWWSGTDDENLTSAINSLL